MMKRNLEFHEVVELRKQVVLNSLYLSDYKNNLDVSPNVAAEFFDGFVEFMTSLAEEDGFKITTNNFGEFFQKYDTVENLENWWGCFEDCPLYSELEDDMDDAA